MAAVDGLLNGNTNKVVGIVKNEIVYNDIDLVIDNDNHIDENLYNLNNIISR